MNGVIYIILGAAGIISLGTIIMYSIEAQVPDTQIKTPLDALWWCISTVTTVGYGDVVPTTSIGRIVAMIYMGFGITMISVLLAVISNNFYKKRIENVERRKKEEEEKYLRDLLLSKIINIEEKQIQYNRVLEQLSQVLTDNNIGNKK